MTLPGLTDFHRSLTFFHRVPRDVQPAFDHDLFHHEYGNGRAQPIFVLLSSLGSRF